jgi:hypothetical protein
VSDDKYWCWRVRFYFRDPRGSFEAGADGSFPAGTTAMEAIREVARWRNVDLDRVHSVEATLQVPDPHTNDLIDWSEP